MQQLDQLARECGASVLGDPPHYLMTAEQLAELVRLMQERPASVELPPLPY